MGVVIMNGCGHSTQHTDSSIMNVISVLLLLLGLCYNTASEQCITDRENPCRATCRLTTLDISNLFQYP